MEKTTRMLVLIWVMLISGLAYADRVDINTADAQTLATTMDGIGDAKALAIVTYREQFGPFRSVDDLKQVKGIGDHILELNRDTITVSSNQAGSGR